MGITTGGYGLPREEITRQFRKRASLRKELQVGLLSWASICLLSWVN